MSLQLRLAALWMPPSLLQRELDRVARVTTAALDDLLAEHAPWSLDRVRHEDAPQRGTLAQRRAAMGQAHERRVAALVQALGREQAVALGRAALFPVGQRLGREVRARLGVGNGAADLLRAARVLYNVLGIAFTVQWQEGRPALLCVHRCALAAHYAAVTCAVLSATDEGVVRGLNPGVRMRFQACMPAGAPRCLACLEYRTEGSCSGAKQMEPQRSQRTPRLSDTDDTDKHRLKIF
jgi:hypothetical protein